MNELEQILKIHALRYPKMQPTDAVKLIYQNEFGGGHLIRDEAACLSYLRREYDGVEKNATLPACEEIGNGMMRVHLPALSEVELDRLGGAFIRSAATRKGTLPRFLEKLDVLRRLTEEEIYSFHREELRAYLAEYAKAGYPAVSHSQAYRDAYHPAYRIVEQSEYSSIFK